MINNDLVKKHIIDKIKKAELFNVPFAYKFVENIFPMEFYNNLLQNLPDKSFYTPIIEKGLVDSPARNVGKDYSPGRFVIDLDSTSIEVLPKEKKIF